MTVETLDLGGLDAEALAGSELHDETPLSSPGGEDGDHGHPDDGPAGGDTGDDVVEGELGGDKPDDEDDGQNDDDAGDAGADEDEGAKERKRSGSARWRERALRAEAALQTAPASASVTVDERALEAAVAGELGPAPKEADFKDSNGVFDYLAFERATMRWETASAVLKPQLKRELAATQARGQAAIAAKIEDHQERAEKARSAIGDYDKVMKAAAARELPNSVVLEVLESPKSELILYAIAKDSRLADKLATASPREVIREIARLESVLKLPTKTATRTPAPLAPIKGKATARRSLETMSQAEYERARGGAA